MKRIIVAVAAAAALSLPAAASASQTVGIPGFNCSVTADTPGPMFGGAQASGGVSCGGAQYNYSKQLDVYLQQLVSGGWQNVGSSGWEPWSTLNPYRAGFGAAPCTPGRWYASDVLGQVSHNGTVSGAEANSRGSGWQCP